MKYVGSKASIAKYICPIIQSYVDEYKPVAYVEPFVGGGNVITKIKHENKIGYDSNKYLIALLNYVKNGGILPENISREEYHSVKEKHDFYEDWYVGCIGFLSSYNAKFFNGYAGTITTKIGTIRNYYDESKRNLLKQDFSGIELKVSDYTKLDLYNCVIYCDPPYIGTTNSYNQNFSHLQFWNIARKWAEDNIVLVSEQTAPDDIKEIWRGDVKRSLDKNSSKKAVERLFIV